MKLMKVVLLLLALFSGILLLDYLGGWDAALVGTIIFILLGAREIIFDW